MLLLVFPIHTLPLHILRLKDIVSFLPITITGRGGLVPEVLERSQGAALLVPCRSTSLHSTFQVAHGGLAASLLHATDALIRLLDDEFVDDLMLPDLWCLLLPHLEDGARRFVMRQFNGFLCLHFALSHGRRRTEFNL